MKILQVGYTDVIGNRFNGVDLGAYLRSRGHAAGNIVWEKNSRDGNTREMCHFARRAGLDRFFDRVEGKLGVQSLLFPFPFGLPLSRDFITADVVNYHILHGRFFSLASLPLLTRLKPSVWTVHDPWAVTGHCLHPMDCGRWKTMCGGCPDLLAPLAMRRDNTAFMCRMKKRIYGLSRIEFIVASGFMKRMLESSPLVSGKKVHLVPFGVDLSVFCPGDRLAARRIFGIPAGDKVIAFRAFPDPVKGLDRVKKALAHIESAGVTLLAFGETGLVEDLKARFRVVETGKIFDADRMASAYRAADIFVMPSRSESFGMTAVEAMACAVPVVVCDGTALTEIVCAPEGGVSVPQDDAALAAAVSSLLAEPDRRASLGARARELAVEKYDFNKYAARTLEIYSGLAKGMKDV